MVGWHYQFNGHEFEQTPGDGEKQGSLVLQSGTTEWLNNCKNKYILLRLWLACFALVVSDSWQPYEL